MNRILELLQLVRKSEYDYLFKAHQKALGDYDSELEKNDYLKTQNRALSKDNELLKSDLSKAKLEIIELKKKNKELESLPKLIKLPSPKRTPIQKRTTKSSSKQSAIVKKMHI